MIWAGARRTRIPLSTDFHVHAMALMMALMHYLVCPAACLRHDARGPCAVCGLSRFARAPCSVYALLVYNKVLKNKRLHFFPPAPAGCMHFRLRVSDDFEIPNGEWECELRIILNILEKSFSIFQILKGQSVHRRHSPHSPRHTMYSNAALLRARTVHCY